MKNTAKTIKILHCIYDSPYNSWIAGGGAYRTMEIYSRFPENYQITILSGNYFGKKIHRTGNIRFCYLGIPFGYYLSRLSYIVSARFFLMKNRNHFDLLIEDFSPFSPVNTYKYSNAVAILQNYYGRNSLKKIPVLGIIPYIWERTKLRKYANYIVVNESFKDIITRKLKASHPRIEYIPNGIDEKLYQSRIQKTEDYILFIGRLELYQKGLDILIEVMKEKNMQSIKLLIAGTGRDQKIILKKIKDRTNIIYLGRITGEKKTTTIKKAKFIVMPSRYEAFSLVAIDSAAAGKAVVGFDDTGLEQTVINKRTGILIKDRSVQAFAAAIFRLWHDPLLLKKLSIQARKFAEQFRWDILAQKQLQFYRDVLNRSYSREKENSSRG